MHILYEDNHLLAIEKPAGILTQPTHIEKDSLEIRAKEWIREKYQKKGAVFLEAVHRIDKPVSGIVLFSKTSKGLSRLNKAIREGKVKKVYVALVEGTLQGEGVLENTLIHKSHFAKVDPQGKYSILKYKVIENYSNYTKVEVELITGRYHQIRVQFSHLDHPLLGDKKYGSKTLFKPGAIALHHTQLSFPHPISETEIILQVLDSFK